MPDEQEERPDYVEKLKTLENAALASDIHEDKKRGVYSVEAMRDFYRRTVEYFDKDYVLHEALDRAEAHYEQGGNGPGSVSLSKTMVELGKEYLEILLKKMNLPEAYAYLTDGEELNEETKALFGKYTGRTFNDVEDKLDKVKISQIVVSLMQYRFDKLIPNLGKRVRDSRIAHYNRLRLENIVQSDEE